MLDETLLVRPPMPKREIPALLAAATVATSLFRPIPEMESNSANKFFDALAAGRPVAINYGGWHRQLLHERGAGIALPRVRSGRGGGPAGRAARRRRRPSPAAARERGRWRRSSSTATGWPRSSPSVLERVAARQMSAA